MNKHLLILVAFSFVAFSGKTQTVSMSEAIIVAENFLGKNQKSAMYCAKVAQMGNDTLLYVFNTDKAFVVVSASEKTIPILAYSKEGVFDEQEVIPPVAMWLNHYQRQIAAAKNNGTAAAPHAAKAWKQLLEGGRSHKSNGEEIEPFLRSRWGQAKAYNYYCPKDAAAAANGRCVTGCVATAMAQLLYYFRFPQSGAGSYSYQHDKYGTLSANFAAAKYDYAAMCDLPANPPVVPNAAIGLLMYHCGVAVDMVYGPDGSGMYNHKAAYALKTHFKFSPQTQYVFRDSVFLNWDSLIVWHLERKIPLYYAGWSVPDIDGHAFICDGYQKDEQDNYYYHFDFGWDGQQNGYYHTDTLYVGSFDFNLAQEMIIHAYPDTLKETYPSPYNLNGRDTLTAESGSFTDGSSIFKRTAAHRDFTWVILPDADTITRIRFSIHYQLSEKDTLFIEIPGANTPTRILTDTAASLSMSVNGRQIIVRLKTASGDDASGIFHASYSCEFPLYCNFEVKLQSTGTLSDGSGNRKYNNMTSCEKRIILGSSSYTAINIHFTKFETEKERDFLHIYDFSKTPSELLISLSGTLEDMDYTFNTKSLSFIFETDECNAFEGWELVYDAGYAGVAAIRNYELRVYPNPVNSQLRITNYEGGEIQIFNIVGQTLMTIRTVGTIETIDVSHLAKGMYFLKVGNKVVKFVKE
jgi:hypothetical protein